MGFLLVLPKLEMFHIFNNKKGFVFLIPKRSSSSSNENETGFEERTHTAEGLPSLLLTSLMAVPPLLHHSLLKHHLPQSLPCSSLSRRACEACQNGAQALSCSMLWVLCPHTFEDGLPFPGKPFTTLSGTELLCIHQSPACSAPPVMPSLTPLDKVWQLLSLRSDRATLYY